MITGYTHYPISWCHWTLKKISQIFRNLQRDCKRLETNYNPSEPLTIDHNMCDSLWLMKRYLIFSTICWWHCSWLRVPFRGFVHMHAHIWGLIDGTIAGDCRIQCRGALLFFFWLSVVRFTLPFPPFVAVTTQPMHVPYVVPLVLFSLIELCYASLVLRMLFFIHL